MADGPRLLDVGRVGKPHALGGEVVVTLVSNRAERMKPGSVLQTDHGPLVVDAARPHAHRWIVRFEGVETRERAETLRGLVLRGEALELPGELWVHEMVGASVVSADGTERGSVTAVQSNPAADLLVLDSGALVPLTFVTSFDGVRLEVDTPPGLFELFE